MQDEVENIYVSDEVMKYIVELVNKTRSHDNISLGSSPRGSIALINMAKANAYLHERDYVIPQDVKEVFYDVMNHRILLKDVKRGSENRMKHDILNSIKFKTNTPGIGKYDK